MLLELDKFRRETFALPIMRRYYLFGVLQLSPIGQKIWIAYFEQKIIDTNPVIYTLKL